MEKYAEIREQMQVINLKIMDCYKTIHDLKEQYETLKIQKNEYLVKQELECYDISDYISIANAINNFYLDKRYNHKKKLFNYIKKFKSNLGKDGFLMKINEVNEKIQNYNKFNGTSFDVADDKAINYILKKYDLMNNNICEFLLDEYSLMASKIISIVFYDFNNSNEDLKDVIFNDATNDYLSVDEMKINLNMIQNVLNTFKSKTRLDDRMKESFLLKYHYFILHR